MQKSFFHYNDLNDFSNAVQDADNKLQQLANKALIGFRKYKDYLMNQIDPHNSKIPYDVQHAYVKKVKELYQEAGF